MINTLNFLSMYVHCPTCKAKATNVVKETDKAQDGTCYEHVKFECGCTVRYIPIQQVIRTTPCPNSGIALTINRQRLEAIESLKAFTTEIEATDIDAAFFQEIFKNAINKAEAFVADCKAIPKSEIRVSIGGE